MNDKLILKEKKTEKIGEREKKKTKKMKWNKRKWKNKRLLETNKENINDNE